MMSAGTIARRASSEPDMARCSDGSPQICNGSRHPVNHEEDSHALATIDAGTKHA